MELDNPTPIDSQVVRCGPLTDADRDLIAAATEVVDRCSDGANHTVAAAVRDASGRIQTHRDASKRTGTHRDAPRRVCIRRSSRRSDPRKQGVAMGHTQNYGCGEVSWMNSLRLGARPLRRIFQRELLPLRPGPFVVGVAQRLPQRLECAPHSVFVE